MPRKDPDGVLLLAEAYPHNENEDYVEINLVFSQAEDQPNRDGRFLFKKVYIPILIESLRLVMEKSAVEAWYHIATSLSKEEECDQDVSTLGGGDSAS